MYDSYIRYLIIAAGAICVLISLFDPKYIINALFKRKNNPILTPVPTVVINTDKQGGFLEIVSLWYQLKTKCDLHKLKSASDKLDEVFPLLNGVLEDES